MKLNKKIKYLNTERLLLREIRETDTSLIVKWRSDPQVYQYFLSPRPITREEHLNWYYNCYKGNSNRIDFMAVEKESGREKGVFNIKRDFSNSQNAEIGYLLDKCAQGKGYAQEVIRKLMVFAKNEWKCDKIIFLIHEENKASQVLADKLGYAMTGRKGKFMIYQKKLENIGKYWGGEGREPLKIISYVSSVNMHQVAA